MKRFIVFDYPDYYPAGGVNDFVGDFETEEDAKTFKNSSSGYRDIIDTQDGTCLEGYIGNVVKTFVWGEWKPLIPR